MRNYKEEYERWVQHIQNNEELISDLQRMEQDDEKMKDAFYQDLSFGTAGLRGVLGAGINRMNIYTVGKASQGLASDILKNFREEERIVAISYDSRINSELFAKTAAGIFAENGIKTYIFPALEPTPCLSFAVRELHAASGVMVTASHNPAKYNGYKVYGNDGCQMTDESADRVLNEIQNLDIFSDIRFGDFDALLEEGKIEYISDDLMTSFIETVKGQSVLSEKDLADRHLSIVYTPLNGTGLVPVLRTLSEVGFDNITVVEEQREPDGHFPTCSYPNPEMKEAMALGLEYAKDCDAELLLATDPDADRVAIAVKDEEGNHHLLSGNETGCLLVDFVLAKRIQDQKLPKDPYIVKTVVTSDLAKDIADSYGVETVEVLTGFKYIGDQILQHEKMGKEDSYVFGFEESCGYLSGTYVRDKDGVDASLLICEMAAYYKANGSSSWKRLQELYGKYGYRLNKSVAYEFSGIDGQDKMKSIMEKLRAKEVSFGEFNFGDVLDFSEGLNGLPKSNVLKFFFDDGNTLIFRPSGTEPKLKCYFAISAETKNQAGEKFEAYQEVVKRIME